MFYYGQIDKENYCFNICQSSHKTDKPFFIALDDYNISYIGRKYDAENGKWLDEYKPISEQKDNHPTNEDIMNLLVNGLTDLDKTLNGGL